MKLLYTVIAISCVTQLLTCAKQTLSLNDETSIPIDKATAAAQLAAGKVSITGNPDDVLTKKESVELKKQEQEIVKQTLEAQQRYQNSQANKGVEFKAPPLSRQQQEEENTKLLNQTLMTILAIIGFLLVCVIIGWIIWSCAHKKEDYFQFEEDKHAPQAEIQIAKVEERVLIPQPLQINQQRSFASDELVKSPLKRMLSQGVKRQFTKPRVDGSPGRSSSFSPSKYDDMFSAQNKNRATGISMSETAKNISMSPTGKSNE